MRSLSTTGGNRSAAEIEFGAHLARFGQRAPLRAGKGQICAILDADQAMVAVVLPGCSSITDQDRAEAICAAVNAACGLGADGARLTAE